MKKFLLALSLLLLTGIAISPKVNAQCTPDPSLTVQGIYPDTLLWACEGQYYTDTIDFVFPADTTVAIPFPPFTLTIPFDSFSVADVLNIPAGLTYQCNTPTCVYVPPGGGSPAKGCVSISGTPTVTTTLLDSVSVIGVAHVTILGVPTEFADTINMALYVRPASDPGCATYRDDAFNNALKMVVAPNPMDASSILSYNLKNGAQVEVTLHDIYGRTISTLLNERQSVGNHTVDLWKGGMAPGVYFVRLSLDGGAHIRTQKVVVQ